MLVLDGCATVWDDVECDGVTMTGGCSDLSVFSNVPKLPQQDPPFRNARQQPYGPLSGGDQCGVGGRAVRETRHLLWSTGWNGTARQYVQCGRFGFLRGLKSITNMKT